MAKSKPIGVRFDLSLLEVFREDKIADTPQAVLNFLTEFYKTNRERIDFKKMFEESKLFQKSDNQIKQESAEKNKKKDSKEPYEGLSKGEILKRMREQKQ